VFPTVGQSIEDHQGRSLSVDTDIHGTARQRSFPGPLAESAAGVNTIRWPYQAP
jgi:hypothetical protein